MADSKSEALTNLIQSIASATGWVQHVVELNTALQPFLADGLNLDAKIAEQRRALDQLKSDAASVIAKLTAAAGGAANS